MRDCLGNKLSPGHLVLWRLPEETLAKGLVAQVVAANDRSTLTVVGADPGPASLVIQIIIPINSPRPNDEPALADFLRIVDPTAERIIEDALTKGRKQ